ncbi:uncharacterized protein PHACADRAFT_250776 [Phanerochaete carnosa HHB-10118-sp]|uniref:Uncharacterized protein n=1 Tax=Phanerochaete carnosa (strain HHB-10118-sp) TaxID=650164 RepID=K5VAR1_PHACS|nr:uncharacterized protein PHACADRAFT_250776 [Phanerochaete carnosa HHB-10118-sp]EKM59951.1 hypothetical protein PHACADRAFT_250776 [Phanerochaete carnosa HHB-10118-sp]
MSLPRVLCRRRDIMQRLRAKIDEDTPDPLVILLRKHPQQVPDVDHRTFFCTAVASTLSPLS